VIGVATSNVNFDVLMNYAFYDCRACATHHLSNMTPSNLITQPLLMYSSAAAAKKKGEVSTDDEVVKGWERLKGVWPGLVLPVSHRRRQLYLQKVR
jgi:hypothetical protein